MATGWIYWRRATWAIDTPARQNGIAGIDLRLRRGTFTVVTGRVGSGKTTLLRVLLGLLPRDEGRDPLERRAGAGRGGLFRAAAHRLYRPGAAPLQRLAARQPAPWLARTTRRASGAPRAWP